MKLFLSSLDTPIGELICVTDEAEAIRALQFADHWARCRRYLAEAHASHAMTEAPSLPAIREAFTSYLDGRLDALADLPIAPVGTDFQRKVWDLVGRIPAGQTMHYGEIARRLGFSDPRVAVDVGAANGANPIAVVIPCHRVIAKDGALKGYAWGVHRKRWLLEHEGALKPMLARRASLV